LVALRSVAVDLTTSESKAVRSTTTTLQSTNHPKTKVKEGYSKLTLKK
jgi:hypothetical protein